MVLWWATACVKSRGLAKIICYLSSLSDIRHWYRQGWRSRAHLDADVHEGGVGVHVAHDAVAAHLRNKFQRLAQLLVASTLRDDCRVGVHVAQVRQLVVVREGTQPVKQLRRSAARKPCTLAFNPIFTVLRHVIKRMLLGTAPNWHQCWRWCAVLPSGARCQNKLQ